MPTRTLDMHEDKTTRAKLLDVAERLFIERGYEGVSVREVTEAAGANVAAVNYYFQGKENLFREAVARRLRKEVGRVTSALKSVIAENDPPDLKKVIRTYVSGFMGAYIDSSDGQRFLSLISHEMSERGIATDVLYEEAAVPIQGILKDAIMRALPGTSDERASLCISSMAGQVFHFVRGRRLQERMHGREFGSEFVDMLVEHITEFSFHGIKGA